MNEISGSQHIINSMKYPTHILISIIFIAGVAAIAVTAQKPDIDFPIAELNNCASEKECFAYCDRPANLEKCIDFGLRNGLMSEQDAKKARKAKSISQIAKGPGGCTSDKECEAYCDDLSHLNECVDFALKEGMISKEEAEMIIKSGGIGPGGCRSKESCDAHCDTPANINECIDFAVAHGMMDAKEAEMVKKTGGVGPGGCRSKQSCDAYCEDESHLDVCIDFAVKNGFMDAKEAEMVRKTGMKGPGGCKSKESCDAFCENPDNFPICIDFAVAHGMMDPKEAEMVKKTGGKGPGGCRGQEECDAFCNNPANQETCFNFGLEHGLIPTEDLKRMKEGVAQMKESLSQAPPAVLECLKNNLGENIIEKIQAETLIPGPQIGDQMRKCFEEFRPSGPGGCADEEECNTYCQEHGEECIRWSVEHGQMTQEEADRMMLERQGQPRGPGGETFIGPGGCTDEASCGIYCSEPAHFQECADFFGWEQESQQPPLAEEAPFEELEEAPTEEIPAEETLNPLSRNSLRKLARMMELPEDGLLLFHLLGRQATRLVGGF